MSRLIAGLPRAETIEHSLRRKDPHRELRCKKSIVKVDIEQEPCYDVRCELGEFSDDIAGKKVIDRAKGYLCYNGKVIQRKPSKKVYVGGSEYAYWIPDEQEEVTYVFEDWERAEAFERGEWRYLCIIARAQIRANHTEIFIRGPGVCGIESDCEKSYIKEIAADQLEDLRHTLFALGFSDDEIDQAYRLKDLK